MSETTVNVVIALAAFVFGLTVGTESGKNWIKKRFSEDPHKAVSTDMGCTLYQTEKSSIVYNCKDRLILIEK